MSAHDDFEVEASLGLPEPLPAGEQQLWQGSPRWQSLARHAFHVRKVAAYFLLLALWISVEGLHDGQAFTAILLSLGKLTLLAGLAIGLLMALAWACAREAIFTVTSRRLVVRFGVALRMTLNVPFTIFDRVAVRLHEDGTGDIPIAMTEGNKLAYPILWPFARPWRLRRPEIMLRCIPDAARVADLIGEQVQSPAETTPDTPRLAVAT